MHLLTRPGPIAACLARLCLLAGLLAVPLPSPAGAGDRADGIVGRYALATADGAPAMMLSVFEQAGQLHARINDNDPTPLVGDGDGRYRPEAAPDAVLEFVADAAAPPSLRLQMPDATLFGTRVDDPVDPARGGPLFRTLDRLDAALFDAAFVGCDLERIEALLSEDIEFVHDRTGLRRGDAVRADFARLVDNCPARQGIVRERDDRSLRVYPVEHFGALQTGEHRFVSADGGVTTARFATLWQHADGRWRVARVLSYDHRDHAR